MKLTDEVKALSAKHILLLMLYGSLVGILTGLASVILYISVHWATHLFLNLRIVFKENGIFFMTFILPAIGAGIGTYLLSKVIKEFEGHGVESVIKSSVKEGDLSAKMLYSRLIGSFFTVSSGGSAGLEGPIVTTGGAIGSNIGKLFKLSTRDKNLLIGCGVAGATAGIFNAPITGIIFALEVVLLEWSALAILPIIVTAVLSTTVSRICLEPKITFPTDILAMQTTELVYCLFLGILSGLFAILLARGFFGAEKIFQYFKFPAWVNASLGGAIVGIIALFYPGVMGIGYDTISSFLNPKAESLHGLNINYHSAIYLLAIFALIKTFASIITLSSGGTGGFFAPSFVIGGSIGLFFGKLLNKFQLTQVPNAYVLIGMAGFLSALMHAPMTAIFLVIEATRSFQLILPLMMVSATAVLVSQYFEHGSVYTRDLISHGELARRGSDDYLLRSLPIKDIVDTDCKIVAESMLLKDFIEIFKDATRNYFPVIDENRQCIGILFLDDIRSYLFDTDLYEIMNIGSVAREVPFVDPNEAPDKAIEKFEACGYWSLPVVENGEYIGMLSKSSLFDHYRRELIVST